MSNTNLILMAILSLLIIASCAKDEKEKQVVLTLQPGGDQGKDAVISKIVPDKNFGELEDIHLYAWTQDGMLNVNRVVIDFDLSSIPTDAQIDRAVLSLFFNSTSRYGNEHSGDNRFIIQRITSAWNESTVSWDTEPGTITTHRVSVDGSITAKQDFTDIDITNLIRDMMDNKDDSYGLMLRLEEEEVYKRLLFASSDNQNKSLRPKLEVYYTLTE